MGEAVEVRPFSCPVKPKGFSSDAPLAPTWDTSSPSVHFDSSSVSLSPFSFSIDNEEAVVKSLSKASDLMELSPQQEDAWLPITASRNGNAYYAAFHMLCSGIGIQGIALPVAFVALGWIWGIICLTVAFIWQLYTIYLLVQLHESAETRVRYSRYMDLCAAAFGRKMSKIMLSFPITQLSAGTCVLLTVIGGRTMKMCQARSSSRPSITTHWYLVSTCLTVILSQLPNLNSMATVSLIGAISSVTYYTLLWTVPVAEGRLPEALHSPFQASKEAPGALDVINALGIIAFAFRGHNLILEIQATIPSNEKHPSRLPMWKGVLSAYLLIGMCLFPLAIGGYWAYGHMIPKEGGMLGALYMFHGLDASKTALGLTALLLIVSSLSSFPIYAMPMFDRIESGYTSRKKKPCPWWLRTLFRIIFGLLCFLAAAEIPFGSNVGRILGGFSLPLTLSLPCFIWLKIKKPEVHSLMWWLNWVLGLSGLALSGTLVAAGVYAVATTGVWKYVEP